MQDRITWFKISHTGMQTVHWDLQNKEDLSLSDLSRFVLDVPVRSLHSSMADLYHVIVSCKGPILKHIASISCLLSLKVNILFYL